MAFNNLGPLVLLWPGQSATWTYSFDGVDKGAQFAGADVKPAWAAPHLADNQIKRKFSSGHTSYGVRITNLGPTVGLHNLQGGGLT